MLDAGKLDRRITILRVVSEVSDGVGGKIQTWGDLTTVWAEVRPISDGERWRAQELQVAAVATDRFRIRWGVGVTVLDRIRFDGREFEISGVKELGRRVGQEITATARAEG
jgi:SPP1 family predicted phage head-tail adaptor